MSFMNYIYKIFGVEGDDVKVTKKDSTKATYNLKLSQKLPDEIDGVSVFYPETFFYCEEDILFLRCLNDDILICYDPGIQVTHTNKASTYYGNRFKQELWRLDRLIESRKIYLNILDSID